MTCEIPGHNRDIIGTCYTLYIYIYIYIYVCMYELVDATGRNKNALLLHLASDGYLDFFTYLIVSGAFFYSANI